MATEKDTHTILYAISGLALVLAIMAVIVGFIAEFQTHVSSVKTTNGFSGTIKNNELTLFTTKMGILSGSLGKIETALDVQVTNALLTGFIPDGSGFITAGDTILSGLAKCLVLNQTPLTSWTPAPGTITTSDTALTTFQKLQGNIWPLFSAYTTLSTSSTSFVPLWTVGNVAPSTFPPTIPAGFLTVGAVLNLHIIGSIIGVSGTSSLRLVWVNNSTTTNITVNTGTLAATTYQWQLTCTITCLSSSSVQIYMVLNYSDIATGTLLQAVTASSGITTAFDQATTLTLQGLVTNASSSLTHSSSAGSVPFHP